jgi:hypothetical protein
MEVKHRKALQREIRAFARAAPHPLWKKLIPSRTKDLGGIRKFRVHRPALP